MPKHMREKLEDLQVEMAALGDGHGRSDAGRVVSVALTDLEKLTAWVGQHPAAFTETE